VETTELISILREVQERVRARYPETAPGSPGIPLPDLEPLVRARDAALAKVAAIGTVNPRRGGPLNTLVQGCKRLAARVLDWHVREQVLFNRKLVEALDATIEALAESNRALAAVKAETDSALADHHKIVSELHDHLVSLEKFSVQLRDRTEEFQSEFNAHWPEMKDMRAHWSEWRLGWEHKLAQNEIQFLRSVADIQAAVSHRADLMDANYRDALRAQHADFAAALARAGGEIQSQVLAGMERIKLDYERLIHTELRLIRQRLAAAPSLTAGPLDRSRDSSFSGGPLAGASAWPTTEAFDAARFAERFRGSEERIKAGQRFYLDFFAGRREVLDIGCGRGEFLELAREAGIPATGIDVSAECVAACREKGLDARTAGAFEYLAELPEESLEGIFCAHVVEHLPSGRLAEMIRLCASRLARGGVIAIETPNPECLASLAAYFFLDPTHVRPAPRQLLEFYFQENGLGVLEWRTLSPAVETMPSLASLPEDFRAAFFGGLDYAIIGKKL
jgi:O-antigen chain-terminating methyltransferase